MKIVFVSAAATVAALLWCAPSARAAFEPMRWSFPLLESNVANNTLPGAPQDKSTDSPATGTATFEYDPATDLLHFVVAWYDLQTPLIAMHVHGPAAPGENSHGHLLDVLLDEAAVIAAGVDRITGSYAGSFMMGGDLGHPHKVGGGSHSHGMDMPTGNEVLAVLADGRAYLNVHTQGFVAGELRGNFPEPTTAVPIPLPPAVWTGLGAVGALFAGQLARARRRSAARA